jgi:hypothetical protein
MKELPPRWAAEITMKGESTAAEITMNGESTWQTFAAVCDYSCMRLDAILLQNKSIAAWHQDLQILQSFGTSR